MKAGGEGADKSRGDLLIAVTAGGSGSRMGRDKAGLIYRGETWLERVVRASLATELPVVVVGRTVPPEWPFDDVAFLVDERPGMGPIGGLRTALAHAGAGIIAVACDMPLITTGAMEWLIGEDARAGGIDGTVVRLNGSVEPLFSIYRTTLIPVVDELIAGERYALKGLIERGEFTFVDIPPYLSRAVENLNTPDDLGRLPSEVA